MFSETRWAALLNITANIVRTQIICPFDLEPQMDLLHLSFCIPHESSALVSRCHRRTVKAGDRPLAVASVWPRQRLAHALRGRRAWERRGREVMVAGRPARRSVPSGRALTEARQTGRPGRPACRGPVGGAMRASGSSRWDLGDPDLAEGAGLAPPSRTAIALPARPLFGSVYAAPVSGGPGR